MLVLDKISCNMCDYYHSGMSTMDNIAWINQAENRRPPPKKKKNLLHVHNYWKHAIIKL